MDAQQSAELQVLLEGVPLPASRDMLLSYARAQDASAVALLESLPDREYERLDEVGEALLPRPRRPQPPERLPQPESGKPPGGDDYLLAFPESGAVRPSAPASKPPEQQIEQQTKTQRRQQAKQEE